MDDDNRSRRPRLETGLPDAPIIQVLHCRSANKTVLEIALPGAPTLHRLYWANANEQAYKLIGDLGAGRSLENAVACDAPLVFAREVTWKRTASGFGGGTTMVWLIRLDDHPVAQPLDLADIVPSNANISRLLRTNDGGTCIQVILLVRNALEGTNRKRIAYVICELDLVTRRLTELDRLPHAPSSC